MPANYKFDPEKSLEAILYIANQEPGVGVHKISKILYFADQEHLRKYGRFITGDQYSAMKYGSVPSGAYNLIKSRRGDDGANDFGIADDIKSSMKIRWGKQVRALRKAQTEYLSESDVAALDWAINKLRDMSIDELAHLSHDQAWSVTARNSLIDFSSIVDQQPNADELREFLEMDSKN